MHAEDVRLERRRAGARRATVSTQCVDRTKKRPSSGGEPDEGQARLSRVVTRLEAVVHTEQIGTAVFEVLARLQVAAAEGRAERFVLKIVDL